MYHIHSNGQHFPIDLSPSIQTPNIDSLTLHPQKKIPTKINPVHTWASYTHGLATHRTSLALLKPPPPPPQPMENPHVQTWCS